MDKPSYLSHSSQLYTPKQLSQHLQVPLKTIYHWVYMREIPYVKVGRHLRFHPDKVMEYFEKNTEDHRPDRACWSGIFPLVSTQHRRSLKTGKAGLAGSHKGVD